MYLNENPTQAEMYKLVHGIKVTTAKKLREGMQQIDQSSFEKEFWTPEVMEMGIPESADSGFRESLDFYKKKMRVN